MKTLLIDVGQCVGCYSCQIGCKDEHCGRCWAPYAEEQPIAGQFWMHVHQFERGSTPFVKVAYIPTPCQHCANAPCMKAATNEAEYRRDDGLVIIDPEKAKGQRQIVDACPYHAIFWNEELQIPHLILYHTEEMHLKERKELYTREGREYYHGKLFVPDDLEVFEL